jgi:xylulokinase
MIETPILTIDVGTSALKACLYQEDGQLAATASQPYGYRRPRPGWAEGEPEAWWQALVYALSALRAKGRNLRRVKVIGLTGQMHTAVLLDSQGAVIPPTILWLDRRAAAETAELRAMWGLPPHHLNSTYTLPKLLWLARHQPDVLRRTRTILWPKDYLRYRLTGERATDPTEAGGAALLDWETGQWAVERLCPIGLDAAVLPPLQSPESSVPLLPDVAADLGLSPESRVIIGAGDVIAILGGAPPDPGRLTCSLGSSSMVYVLLGPEQQVNDPQGRIYLYRIGDHRLLGGVSSTTGAALQWIWRVLTSQEEGLDSALQLAASVPPGAEGLIFLPYLTGERSPFWCDELRGAFWGLSLHHDRPHLLRAVMEGVGFSLRWLLDIFAEVGIRPEEIALAGGGARSPLWARILADTCQRAVVVFAAEDTATRPLYAWCVRQLQPALSFEAALRQTFGEPQRTLPQTALAVTYEQAFALYREATAFLLNMRSLGRRKDDG